jgi:hypothetical protein
MSNNYRLRIPYIIVSDNYFEPTGLPDLGSGALEYGLVPVLGGLLLPIGVPILPRVGEPPLTSLGSVPFSGVICLVFLWLVYYEV